MAKTYRLREPKGQKLFYLKPGEIFTTNDTVADTYMVAHMNDRATAEWRDSIKVVHLGIGGVLDMHGSQLVTLHKGAAIVLDYIEGA